MCGIVFINNRFNRGNLLTSLEKKMRKWNLVNLVNRFYFFLSQSREILFMIIILEKDESCLYNDFKNYFYRTINCILVKISFSENVFRK